MNIEEIKKTYDYVANLEPEDGTTTYQISPSYTGIVVYSRKDHKWHPKVEKIQ